jgi:hypothetical protein
LNKFFTNSKVLKAIKEVSISHLDRKLFNSYLDAGVEVETHVVKPGELILIVDPFVDHLKRYYTLVDQISNKLLIFLSNIRLEI